MDIINNGKPTIILPDFRVEQLAQFLLENDIDPQRQVAVCEKLSYPDEIVVKTTLKEVLEMKFGYLCVLVIY
jgi:cobalt-precorrin-7 (C5)-methyltransferase